MPRICGGFTGSDPRIQGAGGDSEPWHDQSGLLWGGTGNWAQTHRQDEAQSAKTGHQVQTEKGIYIIQYIIVWWCEPFLIHVSK